MPRPPRLQIAGGTYHVTSRGNRRQAIYHDDDDRRYFLELFDRVVSRLAWGVRAHCLMTNHFHLVLETPVPNLSTGMHRRFESRLVESESHYLDVLRYVAYNPVSKRGYVSIRPSGGGAASTASQTASSSTAEPVPSGPVRCLAPDMLKWDVTG